MVNMMQKIKKSEARVGDWAITKNVKFWMESIDEIEEIGERIDDSSGKNVKVIIACGGVYRYDDGIGINKSKGRKIVEFERGKLF